MYYMQLFMVYMDTVRLRCRRLHSQYRNFGRILHFQQYMVKRRILRYQVQYLYRLSTARFEYEAHLDLHQEYQCMVRMKPIPSRDRRS